MKPTNNSLTRRKFIATTGAAVAGEMITKPVASMIIPGKPLSKKRLALVGTGIRICPIPCGMLPVQETEPCQY